MNTIARLPHAIKMTNKPRSKGETLEVTTSEGLRLEPDGFPLHRSSKPFNRHVSNVPVFSGPAAAATHSLDIPINHYISQPVSEVPPTTPIPWNSHVRNITRHRATSAPAR